MGLISSRLNLDHFSSSRAHSIQDGCGGQVYLLNKDYFSNYFLMGGERFEINDPDYIFGDICDLNFLSRTKPFPLPYKRAQQNLLTVLNAKQKTNTKVSARISRIPYAFERITGSRTTATAGATTTDSSRSTGSGGGRRQASKTHSSSSSICFGSNNKEPSRPLVMLINIRKETLRLVKSSAACNLDSDFNSLTDSASCNGFKSERSSQRYPKAPTLAKTSKQLSRSQLSEPQQSTTAAPLKDVTHGSQLSSTDQLGRSATGDREISNEYSNLRPRSRKIQSDAGSLLSTNSSTKSCYRSVKNSELKSADVPNHLSDSSEVDDEEFKDALNDTADLYLNENEDEDSEETQQQRSLLCENKLADNAIDNPSTTTGTTISREVCLSLNEHMPLDIGSASDLKDVSSRVEVVVDEKLRNESRVLRASNGASKSPSMGACSNQSSSSRTTNPTTTNGISNNPMHSSHFMNKIYNIEFSFDAEVDCYIRIFYFCTKEVNSNGINYKPQHATYKSKVYYYKKGLNQKFEQPDHTFQPYLFDEDLLIYKPVDINGNYNSAAVFPMVIHCVALQGSSPRQSQSLIATIEKMDDSYAIKPLKQLIFVDGIQYILQDIFGIENKQLIKPQPTEVVSKKTTIKKRPSYKKVSGLREKSYSLQSNLNGHHHTTTTTTTTATTNTTRTADLDSMDKGSLASIGTSNCFKMSPTNSISKLHLQRSTENSFECVVCLAEERDTMLLPCRHLCLCSSCAQSLRYQASTCPICRCPFKAALNLRTIQKKTCVTSSSVTAIASTTFSDNDCKTVKLSTNKKECKHSHSTELKASPSASSSFISLNVGASEDQRPPPSKTTSFITSPSPTS